MTIEDSAVVIAAEVLALREAISPLVMPHPVLATVMVSLSTIEAECRRMLAPPPHVTDAAKAAFRVEGDEVGDREEDEFVRELKREGHYA